MASAGRDRVTVVIASRNRRVELLETLERLEALPGRPPVIVVDNGSTDGSAEAVRGRGGVEVIPLPGNLGVAARNVGVRRAATPLVALCDDDSWFDAGAIGEAAAHFGRHPRLGLLAARVVMEPGGRTDPTCDLMAASPLTSAALDADGTPLRRVLGFVACGALVRRSAFLSVGGFSPDLTISGEESLLALDLAARGWECAYDPGVVARHRPSGARDVPGRRRLDMRNALWIAWARRTPGAALRASVARLAEAREPACVLGALDALAGWRWPKSHRRIIDPGLEAALRSVERVKGSSDPASPARAFTLATPQGNREETHRT